MHRSLNSLLNCWIWNQFLLFTFRLLLFCIYLLRAHYIVCKTISTIRNTANELSVLKPMCMCCVQQQPKKNSKIWLMNVVVPPVELNVICSVLCFFLWDFFSIFHSHNPTKHTGGGGRKMENVLHLTVVHTHFQYLHIWCLLLVLFCSLSFELLRLLLQSKNFILKFSQLNCWNFFSICIYFVCLQFGTERNEMEFINLIWCCCC